MRSVALALHQVQSTVKRGQRRIDAHTRKHVRTWHHTAKPQAPANIQMRETFTPLERLALYITEKVGSVGFFIIIQVCYFLWMGINALAFTPHFDPGPGYVLLLFISNYIQLTLMPLLMIGQNLQGRHAELRAEDEYRISQNTNEEVKLLREELALARQEITLLREQRATLRHIKGAVDDLVEDAASDDHDGDHETPER